MVFTIEEIAGYLKNQKDLKAAIDNLNERNIVSFITTFDSLNYVRDNENLYKYEASIGLSRIKEEQLTMYRNSNGGKGKYWMALSPKWIDGDFKKRLKTDYEIAYWVNYGDNDVYGWFSVESIRQWLTTPELKLATLGGTRSNAE